ncbi:MAG: DUF6298 domain-containing protein [Armatimonadetes bacterium]|nr:DUF6298 domain-containing protein [Armatimonadota bacterium]MDW8121452.1 DUF6298 domain-containing protein [Armatimonadota bacterium]
MDKGKERRRLMKRMIGGILMASLSEREPALGIGPRQGATGPLKVHPANPRYFTADGVSALYLTGSHTWSNLQDMGVKDPPTPFNFDRYLAFLEHYGHNFIRLWRWEPTRWRYPHGKVCFCQPQPWLRTGPGNARDGKPKFDLTKFDPEHFKRLRERVEKAGKKGIYVSVMLFEGHSLQFAQDAWEYHPFHPDNNINGINANRLDYYTLKNPQVLHLQRLYVQKVIETVGELDNVLYEISNEAGRYSTEWQYDMIRFIKQTEQQPGKVHPVGMTFQYGGDQSGSNQDLFNSPADWISPNPEGGYRDDPPPNDGRKVVLNDTDHLWGEGGNPQWVWKSFVQGHHPLFMDRIIELMDKTVAWDGRTEEDIPASESIRKAMGVTRRLALTLPLEKMLPLPELSSSRYCLSLPGQHYVVFVPEGTAVEVDLTALKGTAQVSWLHPLEGTILQNGSIVGGTKLNLPLPYPAPLVVHITKT